MKAGRDLHSLGLPRAQSSRQSYSANVLWEGYPRAAKVGKEGREGRRM